MNRREFLNGLREALLNHVGASKAEEHVRYYNDYIAEEMRNGRTEEEILQELGDPWLLARTLTVSSGESERFETFDDGLAQERYEKEKKSRVHIFGLDAWWKKALLFLAVLGILLVVLSIVTGLIALAVRFALPILLVVIVIKIFTNRNR